MTLYIRSAWVTIAAIALCTGAVPAIHANPFSSKKPSNAAKNDDDGENIDEINVKTKVPLVGEFISVSGQEVLALRGAGLVSGLPGTGEDPPLGSARQMVLDDMKRRGVPKPNELLKSMNFAVVVVTAYMPPLIREKERFDIEVSVPEGSKVKSLNGGYLLQTYLAEHAFVPGANVYKKGHEYAIAEGPILVAGIHENSSDVAGLRRGRIVGGGISRKNRDLTINLRNGFRSVRNATRIAAAIGKRFFEYDEHGQRIPVAQAKTDRQIELKVPPKYRDNYPRYLEVIRKIPVRETELARHVRMQSLKSELLEAENAGQAALSLEAIGDKSIPILKTGLRSAEAEVRFHAAVALAYLGDAGGLDALADAARYEYAFRVFALAAMSTLEDPEVHVRLRKLMDVESAETRYGAFRALTTLDKNDPFVRGEKVNNQFRLHVLRTEGPPMVHLTNRKKTEVVLFGAEQQLRTPLAVRAGTRILVTAAAGDSHVTVSRFDLRRDAQKKVVSPRLADVIRAISEQGATFPDVAQFLAEANAQENLAGRLEIDALPRAGRLYERKALQTAERLRSNEKKRIGTTNLAPNLFSTEGEKAGNKKTENQFEPASPIGAPPAGGRNRDAAKDSEGKVVTADLKTPSDDSDSKPKTPSVKQMGHDQTAGGQAKRGTDSDVEIPDADPPRQSSGFFGGLRRWFSFGDRGVSGNKEP